MKVAIVVRSLKIGGMERVAITLAKAFQDAGHDTHLIYFKHKKKHYKTDELKNVHFWNFDSYLLKTGIGFFYEIAMRVLNMIFRQSYPVTKGFVTSFIFKSKIKGLEKDSKPFDLIIIRGQGTFEFLWYKQDHRYVQVCENLLYPDHKMTFLRRLYAKALYHDKNIACVSKGVLTSFHDLEKTAALKAKKAVVVTNPVDVDAIQRAATEYSPEIDAPYIVNVGRLAPVKQLSLLVEAYAYIKKRYLVQHKLVIVGQGDDEKNIRQKIKEFGLEDDVILAGVQINPYPWIANADLFVLSSKHEGLGMVLLESLACKTNLVVTKSPGGVTDIMQNELEELLCEATVESLGEKIYKELSSPTTIDFDKHLQPFLPKSVLEKYIHEFATPNSKSEQA